MIYIAILLICVLAAFGLNSLYKRTNHYNNQFVDVRKYWSKDGVPDGLQMINVGSNHPKFGFDYSDTDINGANLAIGPQTFEYDFAILRKNVLHLAPKAVVVFPICLQNFFLYRQENRTIHVKYYTFLNPKDIVGYTQKERFSELDFPLFFHPKRLRYLIKDSRKDSRLEWTENPLKSATELNKDADFWIRCWDREFNIHIPSLEISEKNEEDISQNIRLMKEMITYCHEHGLQPVIAILPVTEYLSSRFSEEYLEKRVFNYIYESAKAGAPVFNYLKDERFTSPALYINSFFFNKKGRKAFTKVMLEDMKQKGLL